MCACCVCLFVCILLLVLISLLLLVCLLFVCVFVSWFVCLYVFVMFELGCYLVCVVGLRLAVVRVLVVICSGLFFVSFLFLSLSFFCCVVGVI